MIKKKKNTVATEFLTKALIVSGTANIALLSFLFYGFFREVSPSPYCSLKPADRNEQQVPLAIDHTNAEVIHLFRKMTLPQLVGKLSNSQLIENGYTQRDLALGSLISFHYFDLSRALLGRSPPTQQRKIAFAPLSKGDVNEVIVYPGLTDADYSAIIQYAKSEKWPFTSKGLYLLLCKQETPYASLADAFYLTPEFLTVEMLFNRADVSIEKNDLLKMLCQGNWEMLTAFVEAQRVTQDLSDARRQRFLLDYIQNGSQMAAALILKTDGVFAAKKLDDAQVLMLLTLLEEKTPESESFAISELTSPRGDKVWQQAATRLYAYANEPKPEKWHHELALHRFAPNIKELFPQQMADQVSTKQLAQKIAAPAQKAVESPKVVKANKSVEAKKTGESAKVGSKMTQQVAKDKVDAGKASNKQIGKKSDPTSSLKKTSKLYVVQEGDSLWKISRSYKVELKALKDYNQLASDFLKPGTILRIPSA